MGCCGSGKQARGSSPSLKLFQAFAAQTGAIGLTGVIDSDVDLNMETDNSAWLDSCFVGDSHQQEPNP